MGIGGWSRCDGEERGFLSDVVRRHENYIDAVFVILGGSPADY